MVVSKKKVTKAEPPKQAHNIRLLLPYPPSMNHYWRRVGDKTVLSKAGRDYKALVGSMCDLEHLEPQAGRLALTILAFPPDNRVRDLDNIQKAILDSLKGRVFKDDDQIDCLGVERHQVTEGGAVLLDFRPLPTWDQLELTEAMALAGYSMGPASLAWRPKCIE